MKLGVFFIGSPQSGGLYQYSLSILDSLKDRGDTVIIFNFSGDDFPYAEYRKYFKISRYLNFVHLKQLAIKIYLRLKPVRAVNAESGAGAGRAVARQGIVLKALSRLVSWVDTLLLWLFLKLNRINLVIFTAPTHLSFRLMKLAYMMPVHDLQHRLNPRFPEVSADGTWEEREYLYSNAIPNAAAILVDSPVGREDVLSFYRADPERVKVLPYVPPNYLRGDFAAEELDEIRSKYHLPPRFLFYPANFWPHKNHALIIEALNRIKKEPGLEIPVAFTGARKIRYSAFDQVLELVSKYHLEGQVHYLGYVPNEEVAAIYRLAEALVMPTFFGPTNIPYLEAFTLGCPVIGSDIRGVREQIGDAGLLVDPDSPGALAGAILKIWNSPELRKDLAKRGYDIIRSWGFARFSGALNGYIDEIGESLK